MVQTTTPELDQLRKDREELEGKFERCQATIATIQASPRDSINEYELEDLCSSSDVYTQQLERLNGQIAQLEFSTASAR